MHNLCKQCGFTLIELIFVIILLGIIGAIGSQMLTQGLNSFITQKNITNAIWQGQLAMERMTREIRYVRSAGDIIINTSGEFKFVDIYGESIDYKLSGSNLLRNTKTIANGVNTLTFSYSDQSGNAVSGTTDVHYVGITMNVTLNNTNYSLTTSIFLNDLSS